MNSQKRSWEVTGKSKICCFGRLLRISEMPLCQLQLSLTRTRTDMCAEIDAAVSLLLRMLFMWPAEAYPIANLEKQVGIPSLFELNADEEQRDMKSTGKTSKEEEESDLWGTLQRFTVLVPQL
ncbi:unnamed protein product [Eretmochelys imbricata]